MGRERVLFNLFSLLNIFSVGVRIIFSSLVVVLRSDDDDDDEDLLKKGMVKVRISFFLNI